ncbi:TonB-dependent receptor [Lutibacter sp. HS1-25]|uniref:SusC/RagA family TonB-linked outer membrane protein n=1 Tax=Lutibacter sp. HS1-25 TaxID=2485000 RepID=UPI0010113A72|nr:TonB-dependent receptor [Lutibacter sp. HS1-25]RXP44526.1 TonB-dependent receptor [Lutibacter sp. HS1-25]
MKKAKILYLLIIFPMILFAQSKEIKGTVVDENNNLLPGSSIVVKGTTIGTSADFDGNFTLVIPEKATTLIVSYLGYIPLEVKITNETIYKIQLASDRNTLEEVVVVGYGTLQRKDITGSVSKIKETTEIAGQYTSASAMLQGRSAGVQVLNNTGSPNAPASVRIRGTNSLRGNNEPLYVIDGVIISSAGEDVINATNDANEVQQTQNGLTGLNMRDVESMEILKDASATAIYGSRGANGVVLITTKKGKEGKAVFNIYNSATISQVSNKISVLDPVNYAQYRNQSALINGNSVNYQIDGKNVYLIQNGVPNETPLRQINWQDDIYKLGYSMNAGLNLSGASDKSNYYFSGDYNQLEGNVPNTFLHNANVRLNYTTNVSDKVKIDTRVGFYLSRGNMNQGASRSGGQRSFTRQLVSYNPLIDGELADEEIGGTNPFTFLEGFEEKIKEKRLNASLDLTYNITEGLKYVFRAGTNYWNKYRSRWYGPETFKGAQTNGDLSLSTLEKTAYTFDNLLMYNKTFNKIHRLNATIGVTYDGSDAHNTTYEVGQFPINTLEDRGPQYGELVIAPFSSLDIRDAILSYLARVNYTLNNKYVFNGTFRVDQSSKFKGSNKTGLFPSFSFAWMAAKENFLKNSKTINNLKIRASWGEVGNQAINPYQTYSNYGPELYSDANNSTILGVIALNIGNEDLTWETTTQLNLGLDIGLFKDRLSASIDVYHKQTSDLLINLPTPPSVGFPFYLTNQGGLENKGLDISIDGLIVDHENFKFSLGGNISFNKNKVTDLGTLPKGDIWIDGKLVNESFYLGNGVSTGNNFKSPANIFIEGQPVGLFWGFETDGIYTSDAEAAQGPSYQGAANLAGDVRFVDKNGDGNVNDEDKTNIGNPNADFVYGINANLDFKNFNISMLFNGSQGNDILNGNLLEENVAAGNSNNIRPEAYFDAWSTENPTGAYPRIGSLTSTTVPTDRLVEDGSYFRLSNITVGYNIDLDEQKFIDNARIYIAGNNLFTITNYSGYDPEITSFLYDGTIIGVDWLSTPNVSSVLLGVNIKF